MPFGDLDDTSDPSVRFGLPRGVPAGEPAGPAPSSFVPRHVRLHRDAARRGVRADPGRVRRRLRCPSAGDLGRRARVLAAAPFFVTGSAGYARFRPGGDGDGVNGVDLAAGLGFLAARVAGDAGGGGRHPSVHRRGRRGLPVPHRDARHRVAVLDAPPLVPTPFPSRRVLGASIDPVRPDW